MLRGRHVLLCVTGGVAAYKSAYLARLLIEDGAEVRVAMSEAAENFIGPQTFAAITGTHPMRSLFDDLEVSPHTQTARWADLVIIAPATAATIGRLATGVSSDLISATVIATEAPVLIAPAMHTEMWNNPATQRNIQRLVQDGVNIVGPNTGSLAGGDIGVGRVAEPDEVLESARRVLDGGGHGRPFLVTAGGTREPIDPVRYIGNRSSGKMGHAIANAANRHGFDVTLVTTSELEVDPGVKVVPVETANEMLEAVAGVEADIAVMAAAVADFRPKIEADEKLSRSAMPDSFELEPTPDVLMSVMERSVRPFVVGFAAETGGVDRAVGKAASKGVDLLIYNNVAAPGSGFGTDTNQVSVIDKAGTVEEWPLMDKIEVADRLVKRITADTRVQG